MRTVWLIEGPKSGDNAQVRALGAALVARGGWRSETKPLRFHRAELLAQLVRCPNLIGLVPQDRSTLAAPWPDLVVGAGRRAEPVARWIQRSAARQRVAPPRLVHLGRPWSRPSVFDLVVSSRQYDLPGGSNVLSLLLPLTAPATHLPGDGTGLEFGIFDDLPRPWSGVLIGGDSGYLIFDATRARDLANALIADSGHGSLIIVGSPRTPDRFLSALSQTLRSALGAAFDERVRVYPFRRGLAPDGANPYRAVLGTAERLIVTSDSVSMVLEAVATGTPTYLHDVQPRGSDWWRHPVEYRWRALSHRLVQVLAPRRLRRDVRSLHAALIAAGHVRWLKDGLTAFAPEPLEPASALVSVVDRVEALFRH
ncbi:MAG: ELM1/GtrOC1 family putative glycosyltransferase [Pseudomonadales bacterium]